VPIYHFKIVRDGQTEDVRGLEFRSDFAALQDAQMALGDEMRDAGFNPKPRKGGTTVVIEVFNRDGELIGSLPGPGEDRS
jgi:hypothetical protein